MERAKPGYHSLVRAGITNEAEAERLARSGTVEESTIKPSEETLPGETIRQEEVDP